MKKLRALLILPLVAWMTAIHADTVTFTAGKDTSSSTSLHKDGITIALSAEKPLSHGIGDLGRNDDYRIYVGSDITIASDAGNITEIKFECMEKTYEGSPAVLKLATKNGVYTRKNNTGIWKGSSNTIKFHVHLLIARIKTITVTYTPQATYTGSINVTTPEGYATFYTDEAFIMPQRLKGHTISSITHGITYGTTYAPNDTVPSSTPLLIEGEQGIHPYQVASTAAPSPTDNLLRGYSADTLDNEAGYRYFILSYNPSGKDIGLYYQPGTEGLFVRSAAGKAYLKVPESMLPSKGYTFDTTHAIFPLSGEEHQKQKIHDLQGRPSPRPSYGFYIINGKKYYIKKA
uniref:hypothetical protein n=2 Tax=Prevotella heparinolytica TaxID=28113 RepID=UPI00359F7A68